MFNNDFLKTKFKTIIFCFLYMNTIISSCCHSFTVPTANGLICSNCRKQIFDFQSFNEETTLYSLFNSDSNIIKTAPHSQTDTHFFKRFSKDSRQQLLDNVLCVKCGKKCRFMRDDSNNIVFVCSECRNVQK